LHNWINYDTLHQQDQQKDLVAKNCKKTQSEITAKLSGPKMLCAFLNSVNSPLRKKGRVTAVVAKARYKATKDQAQQRVKHSAWCRPSNTVIKVLLDSGPYGDIMFQKGHPYIPPT
jgi:hypothetical protein